MSFNPYFDLRVLSDSHGKPTNVVIHSADPLVLTQDPKVVAKQRIHLVSKDCDLEVHADELTLAGPLEALGCNITLFARVIKCCMTLTGVPQNSAQACLASAKQHLPRITVDGAPPGKPPDPLAKNVASPKEDYKNRKLTHVTAAQGHGRILHINGRWQERVPGDVNTPGATGDGRLAQSVERDPRMDGAPGDAGAAGHNAGSIAISADWLVRVDQPDDEILASPDPTWSSFVPMLLYARGGGGGTGQTGQPGADGDDGGPGADFKEVPQELLNQETGGFAGATDGGTGGSAGNGGTGGPAGPGGKGGDIFVSIGLGADAFRLDNMVAADKVAYTVFSADAPGGWHYWFFVCDDGGPIGEGGAGGAPGNPGNGGPAGTGFPADKMGQPGAFFTKQDPFFSYKQGGGQYRANSGKKGAEGKRGHKGLEDPNQVPVGKPGEPTLTTNASPKELASLCRVEHLQMVFDRVGCQYLSIDLAQPDPRAWKLIGATLDWLKRMLSHYPTVRPGNVPVRDAESDWGKRLADQVTALQIRHANGYDYFGKSVTYAPALSLYTYDAALTSSLKTLLKLETKRDTLKQRLDKNETEVTKLDDARAEADGALASLKEKLQKVHQARGDTNKTIEDQGKILETCRLQLLGAMQHLTDEVQSSFGMDASSVISALSQVAFMGTPLAPKEGGGPLAFSPLHVINSSVLAATQIASIIDQASKSVLNDSGEPVQKSYLLKQLQSVETSTLNEQLTKINADGSYKIDAEGASKLISGREKLNDCLREFSKRLTKSQDVIQKFRQYTDAVTARIQSMADYNDLLTQEYEAASAYGQWTAKAHVLEGEVLEKGGLQITDVVYWIDGLHQAIKLVCLSHLQMLHRANSFWGPKVYSGIKTLFGGEIRQIDHDALATAQSTSRSELLEYMETAVSTPTCFPQSKGGSGVLFTLTPTSHPDVFADLREAPKKAKGSCTITIASPAIVRLNGHGFGAGQVVQFTTTDSLPTGISAGTRYYVISAGLTAAAFEISATPDGPAINTSGTQSGTHTCTSPYTHTVSFDIPVADFEAGKEKSPFHGMANVRLTSVRAYFVGLAASEHRVSIVHGGDETIQGPDNRPYAFSHGRHAVPFVCEPARPLPVSTGTCTITLASPAVVTLNGHGLVRGQVVRFTTTGSLPIGLSIEASYYVSATRLTPDAFEISATPGGSAINTSGPQSGTHTCTADPNWEAHVACFDIKEAGQFGLPVSVDTKAQVLPNVNYAPIGPFTHWKIVIEYKDYDVIDLSGVTAVVLDFHGFHQTFNDALDA
jgi:hypothetical protein